MWKHWIRCETNTLINLLSVNNLTVELRGKITPNTFWTQGRSSWNEACCTLPERAWYGSYLRRTAERGSERWRACVDSELWWPLHQVSSADSQQDCCSGCETPEVPQIQSPPECILGRILSGCSGWQWKEVLDLWEKLRMFPKLSLKLVVKYI